jgi:dipeptidase E
MRKIVAIGGGELTDNMAIHREILGLTGVRRPRALYIPTASYDDAQRFRQFKEVYESLSGCVTDVLYLLEARPSRREIERKILGSQAIYVGGGNTLKMMRRWRFLGVDAILKRACDGGIVLAGSSAGGICWFAHGHSDSMRFYNPENWLYTRVRGLGLLDLTFCPHYDSEKRDKDFRAMMLYWGGIGIGLDDNAALEVVGRQFRIISSREEASAHRIHRSKGKVVTEDIEAGPRFRPLSLLTGSL